MKVGVLGIADRFSSTFLAGILGRQSADGRPVELIASMGH
jgi:hypothetical protein